MLLVDKNKDGPKGTVALEWDSNSACFGKRDGFEDFDAAVFGDEANWRLRREGVRRSLTGDVVAMCGPRS